MKKLSLLLLVAVALAPYTSIVGGLKSFKKKTWPQKLIKALHKKQKSRKNTAEEEEILKALAHSLKIQGFGQPK